MTIRELADKIGVSPATVSIVINGKKGVGEETRERVLKALKEENTEPSDYDIAIRTVKQHTEHFQNNLIKKIKELTD